MRTFLDDRPMVEYHHSLPANESPVNLAGVRGDVRALIRP